MHSCQISIALLLRRQHPKWTVDHKSLDRTHSGRPPEHWLRLVAKSSPSNLGESETISEGG